MSVKILVGDCRDMVADHMGRDAILIEINPTYAEMARKRIQDMLNSVTVETAASGATGAESKPNASA